MSWTAPAVVRTTESLTADELTTLQAILDRQRETLFWKCEGLTGEQLCARPVASSELSLLGLLRHLADAERFWFRRCVAGQDVPEVYARADDPDAAFLETDPTEAAADHARLLLEIDAARDAIAGIGLDEQFVDETDGPISLRWTYNHMIEEYARHIGHADLLREAIDGVTGE
jgi:uncharacterized damage-inducible protein DinB